MGVKRDNVPFAGVYEGTESPNKVAKAAKRTFAAVPDLLSLKPSKPPAFHKKPSKASEATLCSRSVKHRTPYMLVTNGVISIITINTGQTNFIMTR